MRKLRQATSNSNKKSLISKSALGILIGMAIIPITFTAFAGSKEQAHFIHERIAGVPPTPEVLQEMTALIEAGDKLAAADIALAQPTFYNVVLKNFVTPWTNEEQTVFDDLNDYSATVIGMIRDDIPFDMVLSADVLYVAAEGVVDVPYSLNNNDHYLALESQGVDLSDPSQFVAMKQSEIANTPLPANATAGVMTTRAAAKAFFSAGTNRAMFRFTSMNYLCRDLEELKDISQSPDRIRQDVTRSPGGDSSIYLNHCAGCHSGMDPLAGAYAYYNFDEESQQLVYTEGEVQPKYLINSGVFSGGYKTVDDSWENYWRAGTNADLGWHGESAQGNGAKSLGRELTATRAFAACQVEQVFETVCLREASTAQDQTFVDIATDAFENENYSMKRVFAMSASYCSTTE